MTTTMPDLPAPLADVVSRRPASPIVAEQQWRRMNGPAFDMAARRDNVVVARWTHAGNAPLAVENEGSVADHCIGLNLKCAALTFDHAGRRLVHGRLTAGAAQVTAPGVPTKAVFASSADVLHLFVSQQVLGECYEDLFQHSRDGDIVLDDPELIRDPVLERLGQALAVSQSNDASLGKIFTDSVSLAIVSRVVARHFAGATRRTREAAPLPQWRMNRVIEFVDAHLAEPIGLAEIASSAGLTRMHFAAQFRRATGLRPHEYLLRRRVEHAQHLLVTSKHNVMDVALSCGFRSQAHFTTVFKKFVGETPHRWKEMTNGAR
ncbi:AraC family transcriptional regulator [Paraburkholderia phymatum]|uniref:Transcriptional regulator, AraC family n=1 Tax=Paraburkholderia phymatum (strain DSM 17167 / CIP 108236 / LMG 21445 / STM815) TaxID=391038 RepID=B2JUY8_PARP8|nr:AraC family transcriptional regulator [Paraburkholderia phymatum]ACC74766.1 transcriptional regulator, AraC family [Paraburkholderia phymatum STM815]